MGQLAKQPEGVFVAPAARDLAVLARQLEQWLAPRLPGAADLRVEGLTYPRGAGQSHETILFAAVYAQDGRERRDGLVVRIKPTSFNVFLDDMFVEQYRLIKAVWEAGCTPVAEPLWFEEDPGLLGAPFFVMRKVVGRVAVSIPSYMETGWVVDATVEQRERLWRNGMRALASVQRVPLASVQFLARPEAGDGFEQEWDRWRRYLEYVQRPRPLPTYVSAWKRLDEARPVNRPPGLVWGDARLGNMIVGDDFQILAVIDWEQPSLGGALQDLGWCLNIERAKIEALGHNLPGLGSREEMIALWHEETGISTADIDWYEAFASFKTSCLGLHMMDMRGQSPPGGDYGSMSMNQSTHRLLDRMGA